MQVPELRGRVEFSTSLFSCPQIKKKILGEYSSTFVNQNDKRKESIDIFLKKMTLVWLIVMHMKF